MPVSDTNPTSASTQGSINIIGNITGLARLSVSTIKLSATRWENARAGMASMDVLRRSRLSRVSVIHMSVSYFLPAAARPLVMLLGPRDPTSRRPVPGSITLRVAPPAAGIWHRGSSSVRALAVAGLANIAITRHAIDTTQPLAF